MLAAVSRRNCLATVAILTFLVIAVQILTLSSSRWDALREHASSIIAPSRSTAAPVDEGPGLPRDYFLESDDQRICEQFYGLSYLRNIANKQHHYCEDAQGSVSTMQCFTATHLDGPWKSDPLCLARGAVVKRSSDHAEVRLPCRLRNFTREAELDPEAAVQNVGVQDVEKMGVYFFDTGAGQEFKSWTFGEDIGDVNGCSAASNNGEWILLAKREGNVNLWHKLMEIWQAMVSIDAVRIARDPATGKPYMTEEEAASIRVVFEDNRNEPLDGWWTMVTGNKPVRLSDLPEGCYGNVIVPLAGSSSPFWSFLLEQRQHEVCRVSTILDTFIRRIMTHLDIEPRLETEKERTETVVTIIDRKKTRKFKNLDVFLERLKERFPDVRFNVIDFAAIPLIDQVRTLQDTDVLVGHHGAGMTHVLFLPPEAAVVEILPPTQLFGALGFRHVARMRGLAHFVTRCLFPDQWNATVNNVPLPDGWKPTQSGWQGAEWTYMAEEEFVGMVDAAIRSQQGWKWRDRQNKP